MSIQTINEPIKPYRFFPQISYGNCEYAWNYIGKILVVTRSFLNAAARNAYTLAWAGLDFPNKVKNITTKMKLCSIASVPFGLVDLKASTEKVVSNIKLQDVEGVALSSLSLTINAADVVDSVATVTNSGLTLASFEPIKVFSAIGSPLGFLTSGLGTVSRIIQVAKTRLFYQNMHQKSESMESFKGFLQDTLKQQELVLLRSIPKELLKELKKTVEQLEEPQKISQYLEKIDGLLQRKMNIDLFGISANLVSISALVLAAVGNASALPFLLVALASMIRITSLVYQDYTQKEQA